MGKRISFKEMWLIFKEAASKWWAKDPFRESATIAYYAIFSIPALLAIVIGIAALFFGQEAVNGQISGQISAAMSPEAAKQVEEMVANALQTKKSVIATIIGVIILIFGATGVLVQLQKSLNNIWEVKVDPEKKQWLHTIKSRLFSLGIIMTLGFLLLISMIITIGVAALSQWIEQRFPDGITYLVEGLNMLLSVGVITLLFALMFKILPDAKIKWKHVFAGGFLTALLFIIGKFALGFYFGKSDPASAYGAAGSVVLILLWVSYSSMTVFFGAELTKAFVTHRGDKVVPKKNAVYVPGLNDEVIQAGSSNVDGKKQRSKEDSSKEQLISEAQNFK
ncbi:MAG: YihY/virulence factor BrkB family protein [Chitinophagales bacterium]|nr:YihY/virulence factor BrkB family protein [Chitinophagales bacterium]